MQQQASPRDQVGPNMAKNIVAQRVGYQTVQGWCPTLLSILFPVLLSVVGWLLLTSTVQAQTSGSSVTSPVTSTVTSTVSSPITESITGTFSPDQVPAPTVKPSAAFAEASFEQNCAACHGLSGLGDGPTAPSLPYSATVFADADVMWPLSPAEMFHTTKFGRIERLMPPWQNRLNDEEIWQAVMYAWSLHTEPDAVASGQTLYAQSCASCHGDTGAGDGPDAPVDLVDFGDLAYAMTQSQEDWWTGWQSAHPEIGQTWTTDQQRQVLEYMRTFSYVPAWESGYQAGDGVIRGNVVQGTAGAELPTGLVITLDAYNQLNLLETFTATVAADGSFELTNLAVDSSLAYIASVNWLDVRYTSQVLVLTPESPTVETTIAVYETTDEAPEIRINRMDWIIDDQPGSLVVVQLYFFGNESDRTFIGAPINGLNRPATVGIQIPVGAEQITFEGGIIGGRYQQLGNVYYDIAPLIPGEGTNQLIVRYFLPYDGSSYDLTQRFFYTNTQTNLLIAELPQLEATVTPRGLPAWNVSDTQEFQGRSYDIYSGPEIPPTEIEIALTGLLPSTATDPRVSSTTTPTTSVALFAPWMAWGVGVFGLVILGGGMVLAWMSGRIRSVSQAADPRQAVNALAQRIAQLDDRHAVGELPTASWQQQRSVLKARLLELARTLQNSGD